MPTGPHLVSVLDALADLLAQAQPEHYSNATPCDDFDVAVLRSHILAWAQFFTVSLEQPDGSGDQLDVDTYEAPADPAEAAALLRSVGQRISACIEGGVASAPVTLFGSPMPGWMVMGMCLGEYLAHGHDLAQGLGLPWNPPAEAVATALEFMPMMLTDDFRGPDKSFGYPVEVPESASDLDKLVAFTGRDPYWKAA
ncbi:TIGR03086 family metal-binding protein [Kineosporia babensis]